MGTREVYEQKLKSGNLHHDPTIKPGLGTPRCPRCLSLLDHHSGTGEWAITPVLHDATAVAGSGIGGMLSAINSFNTGIPYLQNRLKGSKWLPFLVGLPPLLLFSGASAAFGVPHIMRFRFLLDILNRLILPALSKKDSDDFLQTAGSSTMLVYDYMTLMYYAERSCMNRNYRMMYLENSLYVLFEQQEKFSRDTTEILYSVLNIF